MRLVIEVQQMHVADINRWQTCIYLCVQAVRTVIPQGSVRDQKQKVGTPRSDRCLDSCRVSTSLCVPRSPGQPPPLDIARPAVETVLPTHHSPLN